jgi:hypothetical protein
MGVRRDSRATSWSRSPWTETTSWCYWSALEKIGALRGNISIPLASVRVVRVSDTPWSEMRGVRAPGTGLPGVISLGTRRGSGIHDFAAVYGRRPALVIEFGGWPLRTSGEAKALSVTLPGSLAGEVPITWGPCGPRRVKTGQWSS